MIWLRRLGSELGDQELSCESHPHCVTRGRRSCCCCGFRLWQELAGDVWLSGYLVPSDPCSLCSRGRQLPSSETTPCLLLSCSFCPQRLVHPMKYRTLFPSHLLVLAPGKPPPLLFLCMPDVNNWLSQKVRPRCGGNTALSPQQSCPIIKFPKSPLPLIPDSALAAG